MNTIATATLALLLSLPWYTRFDSIHCEIGVCASTTRNTTAAMRTLSNMDGTFSLHRCTRIDESGWYIDLVCTASLHTTRRCLFSALSLPSARLAVRCE